jgi:hypothetical protein
MEANMLNTAVTFWWKMISLESYDICCHVIFKILAINAAVTTIADLMTEILAFTKIWI